MKSKLLSEYRTTPKAKLFIISDSKNNLRYKVDVGPCNIVFRGINDNSENMFVD